MRSFVFVLTAGLIACTNLEVSPSHGSSFGHFEVTVTGDLASVGEVQRLTVGGVRAYDLKVEGDTLRATLQGAPTPGPAEVRVEGTTGVLVEEEGFTYDPPVAGVPAKWAAFGASLTMGTISAGIDTDSQLHGVAAFVARQAGVYLGIPLLAPGIFPQITTADLDDDCVRRPGSGPTTEMFSLMRDPDTGVFDLRLGRIDPDIEVRNLAVGGATVAMVLTGATGAPAILEHLVAEPDASELELFEPVALSQIDRLEKLDPEVALIADLFANDLQQAVNDTEDLQLDTITPLETIAPLVNQMMKRLGALNGQYFIANIPSLTFFPQVARLRAKRLADGSDTADSFDARVKEIDDLTAAYVTALEDAMAPYPNLHLVDFRAVVDTLKVDGIEVAGQHLTVESFGGLLSLDDLHFTRTGFALYANIFIDRMNEVLKTQIPQVDVAGVLATDPLSPANFERQGLDCARR